MHDPLNAFCAHSTAKTQGRAGGSAGRAHLRGQGFVRHCRPRHRRRQSGLARAAFACRAHRARRAGACRCRRRHGGQDPHRRALARHFRRECPLRHSDQSERAGTSAGRFLQRLGGSGGRRSRRFRARHRHRRIGAHPGKLLRHLRHPSDAMDACRSKAWSARRRASTPSAGSRATRISSRGSARSCSAARFARAPRARHVIVATDAFAIAEPATAAALLPAAERIAALVGSSEQTPDLAERAARRLVRASARGAGTRGLGDLRRLDRSAQPSLRLRDRGQFPSRHRVSMMRHLPRRANFRRRGATRSCRRSRPTPSSACRRRPSPPLFWASGARPCGRAAPPSARSPPSAAPWARRSLSLPLAQVDGLPVGLSIVARPGGDEMLLAFARTVMSGLPMP